MFAEYLLPHLLLEGYEGCYTNKQGKVREGSAMFWRTSRFRSLAKKDVLLRVSGGSMGGVDRNGTGWGCNRGGVWRWFGMELL